MMQAAEASHISPSPSFNSYSSETLAQIAARVIQEFRTTDPSSLSDDPLFDSWQQDDDNDHREAAAGDGDDDGDFEFAFVSRDSHSSPVSADDIFCNGQIRPMYPLFDRTLLDEAVSTVVSSSPTTDETAARRRRLPLRKLMFEERETGSCSSSTSEAEDADLDGVAPGTYCVWDPKSSSSSSLGKPCKKSSSAGSSSKRWKLRDLLPRSHSDGKEPPVIFTAAASKRNNKVAHESKPSSGGNNNAGVVSVEKEAGDESKRKPSLPYRQEFIGLFTNVNGVGRNLRPF